MAHRVQAVHYSKIACRGFGLVDKAGALPTAKGMDMWTMGYAHRGRKLARSMDRLMDNLGTAYGCTQVTHEPTHRLPHFAHIPTPSHHYHQK